MARNRNTDNSGRPFSDAVVQKVWEKGKPIAGYDAAQWRHDACGSAIRRGDHGNTNSKNGWEVDHIKPVAKGGTDDLANLQPLQWETNRDKGDTHPWSCP